MRRATYTERQREAALWNTNSTYILQLTTRFTGHQHVGIRFETRHFYQLHKNTHLDTLQTQTNRT
jgi:hypothetical protein